MNIEQHPGLATILAGRHYLIATDGAAKGNPGPGGWGLIKQLKNGDRLIQQGANAARSDELISTNNKMELMAAIKAVEGIVEAHTAAIIMTDSDYVLKGITEWLPGWKAKGWRSADGKPVKNRELWLRLEAACVGKAIHWVKVKAHAGHTLNECANALASNAALGLYPKGRQSVRELHPEWFITAA